MRCKHACYVQRVSGWGAMHGANACPCFPDCTSPMRHSPLSCTTPSPAPCPCPPAFRACRRCNPQEAAYNIGRAAHHLGLMHIAVPYYERALEAAPPPSAAASGAWGRRHAERMGCALHSLLCWPQPLQHLLSDAVPACLPACLPHVFLQGRHTTCGERPPTTCTSSIASPGPTRWPGSCCASI